MSTFLLGQSYLENCEFLFTHPHLFQGLFVSIFLYTGPQLMNYKAKRVGKALNLYLNIFSYFFKHPTPLHHEVLILTGITDGSSAAEALHKLSHGLATGAN